MVVKNTVLENKIFTTDENNFASVALEICNFQYHHNDVYRQYCDTLKIDIASINCLRKIPYLPITFFKSHQVVTTSFEPAAIFESSGTTQTVNSKHFVKDLALYRESFSICFNKFYGVAADWCILALLPSYLERGNSSLVMMADQLIKDSEHPESGFYLNNTPQLRDTIAELENTGQKTLLIGVTFALLDFAEAFPFTLSNTIIMETGGMKGRRNEMTRQQVHSILKGAFHLQEIHSEYGMTELLSQAYSYRDGIFNCPPWMKILIREEDDPFAIYTAASDASVSGAVNIIDLANLYSCSFIATEDAGRLHSNDSFEILGRLDNTDVRGCSLLAL